MRQGDREKEQIEHEYGYAGSSCHCKLQTLYMGTVEWNPDCESFRLGKQGIPLIAESFQQPLNYILTTTFSD